MDRRRLISVPGVLLLLSIFAAGAWVVSYSDGIFSADGSIRMLRLDRSAAAGDAEAYLRARRDEGRSEGVWFALRRGSGRTMDSGGSASLTSKPSSSWLRLGFESHRGLANYETSVFVGTHQMYFSGSFNYHLLAVPYWFIVLVLGIVPAAYWFAARRRRRRLRKGLCAGCGYDLRASTGRCPECGLKIRRRPNRRPQAVTVPTAHPAEQQPG